jgi:uncharacterized protein (TIGR00375 family)
MRVITDFHIHSKWSRACSKALTLPNIAKACERKGVTFVGTGDALHPAWRQDIGELLEDAGEGAFRLKDGSSDTAFLLSAEISSIYKRGDKTRRVHNVICFPTLKALDRLTSTLLAKGCNIKSDGRPIVGIDSEELLKMALDADTSCLFVPAHAWTPWYAVFGSQSGFDSLEECFGGMTCHVHAIETGLSSDPAMNWRLSKLDSVFLVSNSDAHSLDKIGREANVFEMERPSYSEFRRIIAERDAKKFIETIEFFPEEGKYHEDGHRACKYWCEPEQTKRMKGTCPQCGKQLTIGVLHRVMDLADRPPHPERPPGAVPFRSIVPLAEIVASVVGTAPSSKKVTREVDALLREGTNEFSILLDVLSSDLYRLTTADIAEAILAVRRGDVQIDPGYDGEFGTIKPKSARKQIVQAGMF